jgi:hypothetical protein
VGKFFVLRGEIDTEWVFIDTSYVRAHQYATGARRREKSELLVNLEEAQQLRFTLPPMRHGNPIDFEITGDDVHDTKVVGKIIEKVGNPENLIPDKGNGESYFFKYSVRSHQNFYSL